MSKLFCAIIILSFGIGSFAISKEAQRLQQSFVYTIKSGDELGSLMYSMGLTPIWGNKGFVQKIIKLNKVKIQKNGDLIFASNKLVLPAGPFFTCNAIENDKEISLITNIELCTFL